MANELRSSTDVPASTGSGAYLKAIVLEGTAQTDAVLKTADIIRPGRIRRYWLPSGSTTLTLSMLLSGVLSSSSAGSTAVLIPTMASLGFTRDATDTQELAIPLQRCGLGPLFCNADTGVTITDPNNLDVQNLGQYHSVVWLVSHGTDAYHYE